MKTAIISDIHANFEALRTVFTYIDQHKISKIICLGDIVGYGPRPDCCLKLVRERCDVVLMGNHDHAVLGLTDIAHFNDFARAAVLWTRAQISAENLAYLRTLPFSYDRKDALFVHSSPIAPQEWHYIMDHETARTQLDGTEHPLVFIGHSHLPVVYSHALGEISGTHIELDAQRDRYIINAGSVGQPRDGDPRACMVVYDDVSRKVMYVRLDYPIETTYQEILDYDLPAFLAVRLLSGL